MSTSAPSNPPVHPAAYWNGKPFPKKAERLVLPNGERLEDAVIWPDFLQDELGLDPTQIWQDLLTVPIWPSDKPIPFRAQGDSPHWISGAHKALNYRGHDIKRGKIWCQSDYVDGLRLYKYPGWQYKISAATHAVESVKPIHQFAERLNNGLVRSGHQPHNHWIATRYDTQDDNIGFHSDKEVDFAENSFFVVVKLGAPRPFAFRMSGSTEPFFTRDLAAGTAVWVRCKTLGAANQRVQHGVPQCESPVGESGSIVSRSIITSVPWDQIRREVAKRQG